MIQNIRKNAALLCLIALTMALSVYSGERYGYALGYRDGGEGAIRHLRTEASWSLTRCSMVAARGEDCENPRYALDNIQDAGQGYLDELSRS